MELVIKTTGTKIRIDGKNLLIENENLKKRVSMKKLDKLGIKENISISSNAIILLIKNNIEVYFIDWKDDILGKLINFETRVKGDRLVKQCEFSKSKKGLDLSKVWIIEKSEISIEHLKEMKAPDLIITSIEESLEKLKKENKKEFIRGYEGFISRTYLEFLRKNTKADIHKRSLHPSSDIFNISINYTYGILYRHLSQVFLKNNIEPSIGFFHSNSKSDKSLVYDFSEKYKMIFFSNIYNLISLDMLSDEYLEDEKDRKVINSEGKKTLVDEFYKLLNKKSHKNNMKLSRLIEKEIKELGDIIDDFNSL